jgi:hypothetical protein
MNEHPDHGQAMWDGLVAKVKSGDIDVSQLAKTAQALIKAVHDVHLGTAPNLLASLTSIPSVSPWASVLPLLISVLPAAIPLGMGLAFMVAVSVPGGGFRPMTAGSPEEQAWFDRASGGPSAR